MKTEITILYVCSRLLQLNWSQCEPQVQLNWLYVHICYQLNWSQRQVANAESNPTSFRPWKPNCQMTPNEEDIIGGRFSLSSSSSSSSSSSKRTSTKRISLGQVLIVSLFWRPNCPWVILNHSHQIFSSYLSQYCTLYTVQYTYTIYYTAITHHVHIVHY